MRWCFWSRSPRGIGREPTPLDDGVHSWLQALGVGLQSPLTIVTARSTIVRSSWPEKGRSLLLPGTGTGTRCTLSIPDHSRLSIRVSYRRVLGSWSIISQHTSASITQIFCNATYNATWSATLQWVRDNTKNCYVNLQRARSDSSIVGFRQTLWVRARRFCR